MDTLSRLFLKRQKVRIYLSSDSSFAVAAAVTCRCGGDSGEVPLVHPGRVLLSAGDMALRCPRCSLAPQPLMTLIWPASHASSHHALLDAVSAPHLFILLSVYWEQSSLCSSRCTWTWSILKYVKYLIYIRKVPNMWDHPTKDNSWLWYRNVKLWDKSHNH